MFLWPTWSFPGWHLVCFQVQSLGLLPCMAELVYLFLKGLCLPIRAVRVTSVWTLVVGGPQWWNLANSMLQRTFILLFLFTVQSFERFVTSFCYFLLNLASKSLDNLDLQQQDISLWYHFMKATTISCLLLYKHCYSSSTWYFSYYYIH